MHRFKNILLVFDRRADNHAALRRAMILADENRAELTVVTVIDGRPQEIRPTTDAPALCEVQDLVVQDAREQLDRLIGEGVPEGRVRAKVLEGTPLLEVVRAVLRERYDLLITTAEPGDRKHQYLGSTVLNLMRKCPCPVWVIKAGQRVSRILAAVDANPDTLDETRDALNKKIMDLATSLAEREQAQLHIVHAWMMFGESALRSPLATMRPEQVEERACEDREQHEQLLDTLLAGYDLEQLDHRVHLVQGEPNTVIPTLARDRQIDLIVMGSVCRTGIAGFLMGNTAEAILLQVDCAVLTVKPDGFCSPVTLGPL